MPPPSDPADPADTPAAGAAPAAPGVAVDRHRRPRPRISVIVPVYNEEESIAHLHGEITAALGSMAVPYEVIYVDDCSVDRSLGVMLELRRNDPHVRVVKFRRNYGQTAALSAGFDQALGELVVTLDGDLQNDPADIPAMVATLEQGFDIVAGWRRRREDGFLLRRLPSRLANRLIAWVTEVPIHDTGCTLKVFRAELVKSMSIYAEQHRFLPAMSAGSGARVTEMVVNHRPRRYGSSKYGLGRATRVLLDLFAIKLIVHFSQRPLHYFGLVSLIFLAAGSFFAALGLVSLNPDPAVHTGIEPIAFNDWELMVVSTVALVFVLIVFFALLGLLGELAVKASGMHRRGTLSRILNELH